jgi:signal transduction histidine kinase/CheY-like chemotaxis protein
MGDGMDLSGSTNYCILRSIRGLMQRVNLPNSTSLPIHPLTLRFEGEDGRIEEDYKAHFHVRYLSLIRTCHWIGLLFYAGFGVLDLYLFPEKAATFLFIRLAMVCPFFLAGWILTYQSWYERVSAPVLMFLVILTGTGYSLMSAMVPPVHSFGYYAGLLACIIFGYTFIRLPVVYATLAGWLVFLIYWQFGIPPDQPHGLMINQIIYLAGLNLLLMVICYSVERADRHNYYLARLLAAEKAKVSMINAGLEQIVAHRTEDLQSVNEKLSQEIEAHKASQSAREQLTRQLRQAQKMEAIGTMAGGIAHDFNNILGSLMGFTELALDDAAPGSSQQDNLQEVLTAGKRARDLVRQILAFSRRGEQCMAAVELGDVILEGQKLLRATMPTSIEIELELEARPKVLADATQINQLLMNLAINASHAMIDDTGKINIRLEQTEIDPSFCSQHPGTSPGPHARLTITDNGSGIAPEIMDRIFDPFFTTKPQGQGTGLGLSVVHGIVKNHGGAVTVNSQVGQGATFDIYLPVITDVQPVETVEPLALPGGRECILYVDDERSLLNYAHQMLTRLGYQVVIRDNALEALEYFKSHHPQIDLVITDLTMPHMTGDTLAVEIKRIRAAMPIILCSGLDNRMGTRKAEQIGISAVIRKPVLKADLAQTIRRVLEESGTIVPSSPTSGPKEARAADPYRST